MTVDKQQLRAAAEELLRVIPAKLGVAEDENNGLKLLAMTRSSFRVVAWFVGAGKVALARFVELASPEATLEILNELEVMTTTRNELVAIANEYIPRAFEYQSEEPAARLHFKRVAACARVGKP